MRYHLSLARILERDIEAKQACAHPLATLLHGAGQRLLVDTCRHRDQFVGSGGDHVIAEESWLASQLIGPAFVDSAHDLVALAGTDPIPPDAHVHWVSSSVAGR